MSSRVSKYLTISLIISISMVIESLAWIIYASINRPEVFNNLYILIGILSVGYLLPIAIVTSLLSTAMDESEDRDLDDDSRDLYK